MEEKAKTKKPIYKKWWFWVIIGVVLLSFIVAGGDDDAQTPEPPASVSDTPTPEPENTPAEEPLSIELIAGEQGEFGELFTINKDTEFEETYYIYHIPTGTYTATNIGQYLSQITVCSDETIVNNDGWEEPAEIVYAEAFKPTESKTLTIEDGFYIEIHEPAQFSFEPTK